MRLKAPTTKAKAKATVVTKEPSPIKLGKTTAVVELNSDCSVKSSAEKKEKNNKGIWSRKG